MVGLLGVVALASQPPQAHGEDAPKPDGGASQQRAERSNQDIPAPNLAPHAQIPSAKPLHYKADCEAPESNADATYCENQRAAKAEEGSALWAFWQLVLGAFGFAALLLTLFYTRRAARAAVDAAKLAEKAFSIVERPYIILSFIPGEVIEWDQLLAIGGIRPKATFMFKNIGKTPGIILETKVSLRYVVRHPTKAAGKLTNLRGETTLGHGESSAEISRFSDKTISLNDATRILGQTGHLILIASVVYSDIADNKYEMGVGSTYNTKAKVFTSFGGRAFNYDRPLRDGERTN